MDKNMSIIFHRLGVTDILMCLVWRVGGGSRCPSGAIVHYHTFEVSLKLVSLLVGEAAVAGTVRSLFGILSIRLAKIIHGDKVEGYDDLHLGAITGATMILKDYHESDRYERRLVGMEGVGREGGQEGRDDDSLDSLELKTLAVDLWIVLENIMVVKRLSAIEAGGEGVSICLPTGYFPPFVLEEIERRYVVSVIDGGRVKNLFAAVPLFFYAAASLLGKLGRSGSGQAAGGDREREYLVATELVDDECFRGRPGDADYLVSANPAGTSLKGTSLNDEEILLYVTGGQKSFLPSLRASHDRFDVVDLSVAPLGAARILSSMYGHMKVFWRTLSTGGSNFFLKSNIVYIDKLHDLDLLFSNYRIKSHIYGTHPNGRTAFRYDSGLVTGLCRKHGVKSIGLQTRSAYSMGNEYCFNSFDTFCMWGEAWVEAYRDFQFVRDYEIVGSIFLDGYAALKPLRKEDCVKLALFPTGITKDEAHHYTLTSTVDFLLACIGAASSLNKARGSDAYRVAVKLKDPEDAQTLMSSERYRSGVEGAGVDVEYITSRRHDIEECINESDAVIAIGFTTPGMDAFLLGKKAAYYSTFENVNSVFRDGKGLVLGSEGDVKRFLSEGVSVEKKYVDSLDPFRDGRARERIAGVIKGVDSSAVSERAVSSEEDHCLNTKREVV